MERETILLAQKRKRAHKDLVRQKSAKSPIEKVCDTGVWGRR